MASLISVAGYLVHRRKDATLIHRSENPNVEDFARLYEGIRGERGTLSARYKGEEPSTGVKDMKIFAQDGRYVLTTAYYPAVDEPPESLSLYNADPIEPDSFVILHRVFQPYEVFRELDPLARVFERFVFTGQIERDDYIFGGDLGPR